MFKPRKEEPINPSQAGKITMPVESGMPKSSVIKAQMDEANKRRGSTVEQAWTTSKPDQKFLLMCKWEGGAANPVWTLYEETSEESKMHFSQAFDSSDFTMMYDVICMTVPSDSSFAIPDALKPSDKPSRGSSDGPKPASQTPLPSSFPTPSPYGSGSGGGFAPSPTPGFAPPPPPPPPSPYPSYPQNYPQQQQQPQQQPMPYPPQPAPQQMQPAQYNPAPLNQPSPWQQGYPQSAPPQQGYAPSAPPQNAPYAPSQSSSTGGFSAQINPGLEKSSLNSTYSDLMHKQANVLLGTLLFESELINQNTLDAALKVQELVRENQMSPAQASDVLKRHHMMGASIAEYLAPEDFDLGRKPSAKSPTNAKPTASTEKVQLQQSAFDILQKAGLLKEEDLKTATAVRSKHGGDMPSILQAAGKLDATTYLAAETCIPLIKKGAMKVEQCIIALNYCNRSRVDFDSAMDELGWENPRKAAK
jgi:hypothetical protein